ncbi:hypothetical protein ACFL15_00745 [Patescibacteria group bacterium]
MNIRKYLSRNYLIWKKAIDKWARNNLSGLFIFNLIVIIMVLLSNAGYFHPFFYLSINVITFISLVLSVFLLRARNNSMFAISIFFMIFAGFLSYFKINIWAERSAIYSFQSFLIGLIILMAKKK